MDDYDIVMKLWQTCKIPYRPEGRERRDKIEKEIQKETAIFLVAELDEKIVGTVLGTHDGRKGWINRLAVAPEFQHRGIAQRLLKEAEDILGKLGIEIIACLIEDYNRHSMDFFQEAGYTKHQEIIYFTKRKYPEV
jgi:ribosomal protein S18 acetylase RimI-like enzyme